MVVIVRSTVQQMMLSVVLKSLPSKLGRSLRLPRDMKLSMLLVLNTGLIEQEVRSMRLKPTLMKNWLPS